MHCENRGTEGLHLDFLSNAFAVETEREKERKRGEERELITLHIDARMETMPRAKRKSTFHSIS